MSRRRGSLSAELSWRQDQALGSPMRIVRQLGPTAFVLQEAEPGVEEHRVFLGNPHSCSCLVFMKQKEVCKHICWLLLKKFKLPRNHEYALKFGLAEREINQLLQGLQVALQPKVPTPSSEELKKTDDGYIKQRNIDDEDMCAICQELLLTKMLPVTYCRLGCGSSIHINCMKIWADHQPDLEKDSFVKCPLCVQPFAPLSLILKEFINSRRLMTVAEKQRLDLHLGFPCNNCRMLPIEGNCYKCINCPEYHLCHGCFRRFCHSLHSFLFREKRNQRWRPVEPAIPVLEENTQNRNPEENSKENERQVSCVPEHIIKSLHTMGVRKSSSLLDPGLQCRLCLKSFCLGQFVRFLPCNHKFHRKCIDRWLQKENACPIDGYAVYNPLTWENVASHGKDNLGLPQEKNKPAEPNEQDLFVPGTALLVKQMKPALVPEKCESGFQACCDKKTLSRCEPNLTFNDFASSCLRSSASRLQSTAKVLKFSRYVKQLERIAKH